MQQEEWELDLGRDFPEARVSELRYIPAPYSREILSEMGLVRTLAISGDCWKVEWGRGWGGAKSETLQTPTRRIPAEGL